jgi:hypothetical protein
LESPEISGAVDSPRAEWIREEAFLRELRPVQVTDRYAIAADEDLADCPNREGLEVPVEDVNLSVGDRASDQDRFTLSQTVDC